MGSLLDNEDHILSFDGFAVCGILVFVPDASAKDFAPRPAARGDVDFEDDVSLFVGEEVSRQTESEVFPVG